MQAASPQDVEVKFIILQFTLMKLQLKNYKNLNNQEKLVIMRT